MARAITLLSGATASAPPSPLTSATAGVAIPYHTDHAVVYVHSTAGSGTMTVQIRMWGFSLSMNRWYALGTGTTQGLLNGGTDIAEISTVANTIAQAELITGLRDISRLYAEIVAIAGVGTAVTVAVACVPAQTTTT